jgi:hypothetical protein
MFLPPGIVPPVAQFMSPRLKSPPKNILAFLYLLLLLIFETDSNYQYKPYRKELIDKNNGGVLIMVRTVIKSDECPDLDTECEIKWVFAIVSDWLVVLLLVLL